MAYQWSFAISEAAERLVQRGYLSVDHARFYPDTGACRALNSSSNSNSNPPQNSDSFSENKIRLRDYSTGLPMVNFAKLDLVAVLPVQETPLITPT